MADARWVIDTGPLLAYVSGTWPRLPRPARRAVAAADRGRGRLVVPTLCLFEVALLVERGRVTLGKAFEAWCDLVEQAPGLQLLALDRTHVSEARAFPLLRDPFDRLIAGTAVALGLPLMTPDARIARAGRVRVIW